MPNWDREEISLRRACKRLHNGYKRSLTLADEHADFGVQEAVGPAAVARHQLEHRQEGPHVAQPASLVLQLLVHGRLVDALEHVALHLAQGGEQRERLSLLP